MTAITFDAVKFTENARSAGAPVIIVEALLDLVRHENTRQKEEEAFRREQREKFLEMEAKRERILAEIREIETKQETIGRSVERMMAQEPITREYLDLRLDAKFAEVKLELKEEITETKMELRKEITDSIKWTAGIIAIQSVGILVGCATIIKVFS